MKKIVLAEDEPSVRLLVAETLGDMDQYQLFHASDGAEALELVKREMPDLVLLDVDMPVMDGFEVCRAIKGDNSLAGVKVVMLTAMAQEKHKILGAKAGADEYFTKPFSPLALLRKVDELLGA